MKFQKSRSLVFWAVLNVSQSRIFCKAVLESKSKSRNPKTPKSPGLIEKNTGLAAGWVFLTEISATGLNGFSYEHFIPVTGTKRFWQNNFAFATERPKWQDLPSMYFYFRSMRFIFVVKVTRFDKATKVVNDTTLPHRFVFVYRIYIIPEPSLNFSCEPTTSFVPVIESAWLAGLIWKGP